LSLQGWHLIGYFVATTNLPPFVSLDIVLDALEGLSMQIEENIPTALRAPAEAALAWVNKTQQHTYELTGLVDYEQALSAKSGEGYELGLVFCDGDICAREQLRVQPIGDGYFFSTVEAPSHDIPALLDPPEGVRCEWLEGVLKKHEFVLLLFYRGLW